ncbi:MAG: methyltransferase domain-containing protein [Actinobacteria bacterium]|nr:methyltransferase domain-containing protein [Actinomycetota bacterium]
MVHQAAASGFDRAALAYERGRPSYPDSAIQWLVQRAKLTDGSVVVDVAAGTGKLTRLLVASGAQVIAVEPVEGMRHVLAGLVPSAEVLDGTAENIPLAAGHADVITVGQAFHWFDVPAALAEIHRVLRPGGSLALVWNRRLLNEPIHEDVSGIVDPHRGATPSHHKTETWSEPLLASPLFEAAHERSFSNVQRLNEDGLVDRVMSTSFIAALADQQRQGVERSVRDLATRRGGSVALPYSTDVQLFRRSP